FLSEDDVTEGRAKDYRVIYVTQQWMHSKAALALTKWVQDGGTLVALGGGGFLDEFGKPNPAVAALYGVKGQRLTADPQLVSGYLLHENTPFLPKQDLPPYRPIDEVRWGHGDNAVSGVPVVVW